MNRKICIQLLNRGCVRSSWWEKNRNKWVIEYSNGVIIKSSEL